MKIPEAKREMGKGYSIIVPVQAETRINIIVIPDAAPDQEHLRAGCAAIRNLLSLPKQIPGSALRAAPE